MTDIVERLREHADRLDWTGAETAAREREAADEIDRLRAAAERVCWFDWSGNDQDAIAAVDALRAVVGQKND